MPAIPPPPIYAPYETLNTILNEGRVRMNDAIASIGGDILQNTQPFTQAMANSAWRRLQSFLANLGYARLKKPLVAYGYPVVQSQDPASQCQLTWTYYFDGVNFWLPPNVTVLPQDFILPLKVWERVTGQNSSFIPMEMAQDALPDCRKIGRNIWWLWENDTLYMPGSLYSMDFRFEYAAFLPDFVTVGTTQWYDQQVPIMRCFDALAWYFCAEAAGPRDDMSADPFIAKAESAARLIFNQEVAMKQRRPATRRCFNGGSRRRIGWGSANF